MKLMGEETKLTEGEAKLFGEETTLFGWKRSSWEEMLAL